MGFTAKLSGSLGNLVYQVKGEYQGNAVWHYVLVDARKLPLFNHSIRSGSVDVAKYGTVLYSGWGDEPPENIVKTIHEQYKKS